MITYKVFYCYSPFIAGDDTNKTGQLNAVLLIDYCIVHHCATVVGHAVVYPERLDTYMDTTKRKTEKKENACDS